MKNYKKVNLTYFIKKKNTSLKMNDTQYKTKNFIFENSNGFNLIKNILKSDDKPEVKQKNIEDALNQVWHNEITDVLQNKKSLGLRICDFS